MNTRKGVGFDPGSKKHGAACIEVTWTTPLVAESLTVTLCSWKSMDDLGKFFEQPCDRFVEVPVFQGALRSGRKEVMETAFMSGIFVGKGSEIIYPDEWRKSLLGKHNSTDAMALQFISELGIQLAKGDDRVHKVDAICVAVYGAFVKQGWDISRCFT